MSWIINVFQCTKDKLSRISSVNLFQCDHTLQENDDSEAQRILLSKILSPLKTSVFIEAVVKKLPLTYWGHCAPYEPTLTFMFSRWLSLMSLPKTHKHTHTKYLAEYSAAEHLILWNVAEGLFSLVIQILSDRIGYQFMSLISKTHMEMCSVIPLRFSLHRLMELTQIDFLSLLWKEN